MQLEFFFFRKKPSSPPALRAAKPDTGEAGFDAEMTEACAGLLMDLGIQVLADQVRVVWNSRMRTTAGRAFWPEARIEMNPKLKQIAPDEVRQTMLHELAHLVAYQRAGRRRILAHGPEWQRA